MMDKPQIISSSNKLSSLQIRLELPPNQENFNPLNFNLIGKLISSKPFGTTIIRDVMLRAWRPTFSLEVKRLSKDIFMFSFQHETDSKEHSTADHGPSEDDI